MVSSVMLDKVQDDELVAIGQARELVSRIQKLRKTSGISIEDEIEIFYEFAGGSSESSKMGKVVLGHSDKVAAQTKMPFLPMSEH